MLHNICIPSSWLLQASLLDHIDIVPLCNFCSKIVTMTSSPVSIIFTSRPVQFRERADSGVEDSSPKGLSVEQAFQPVIITFTPGPGSTCVSLYPRTKTFTFKQAIDEQTCLATCENSLLWRLTSNPEERLTVERLVEEEPVEIFRSCRYEVAPASVDRRVSVGHFSSGYGKDIMPMRRVSIAPLS